MRLLPAGLVLLLVSATAHTQSSFPRLLPDASEFRITLRELSGSEAATVPLGPSCTGDQGHPLPCRAVSLTLENLGSHIVRLSGLRCSESEIRIERVEPNSSSHWWPVSTGVSKCMGVKELPWTNIRLRPGEHIVHKTRLIAPLREADTSIPVFHGDVTLRASWALWGCTDPIDGNDCLTPLQRIRPPGSVPDVDIQQPVILVSNEIKVSLEPLADPEPLMFSFRVEELPSGQTIPRPPNALPPPADSHCPLGVLSSECIIFHYTVLNPGSRAVRMGTFSCSGASITPEYRQANGTWKPLSELLWSCTANIFYEREIRAGGSIEGYFTLRTLTPRWDTNPIRDAGTYGFRFTFHPTACIAASDASFCLVPFRDEPSAIAPEVIVEAVAAVGEPDKNPF
jgi:hypothetical protein